MNRGWYNSGASGSASYSYVPPDPAYDDEYCPHDRPRSAHLPPVASTSAASQSDFHSRPQTSQSFNPGLPPWHESVQSSYRSQQESNPPPPKFRRVDSPPRHGPSGPRWQSFARGPPSDMAASHGNSFNTASSSKPDNRAATGESDRLTFAVEVPLSPQRSDYWSSDPLLKRRARDAKRANVLQKAESRLQRPLTLPYDYWDDASRTLFCEFEGRGPAQSAQRRDQSGSGNAQRSAPAPPSAPKVPPAPTASTSKATPSANAPPAKAKADALPQQPQQAQQQPQPTRAAPLFPTGTSASTPAHTLFDDSDDDLPSSSALSSDESVVPQPSTSRKPQQAQPPNGDGNMVDELASESGSPAHTPRQGSSNANKKGGAKGTKGKQSVVQSEPNVQTRSNGPPVALPDAATIDDVPVPNPNDVPIPTPKNVPVPEERISKNRRKKLNAEERQRKESEKTRRQNESVDEALDRLSFRKQHTFYWSDLIKPSPLGTFKFVCRNLAYNARTGYEIVTKRGDILRAPGTPDRLKGSSSSIAFDASSDPRDIRSAVYTKSGRRFICGLGSKDKYAGGVSLVDQTSNGQIRYQNLVPKPHSPDSSVTAVCPVEANVFGGKGLLRFVSAGSDHRMFLWDVNITRKTASVSKPPLPFEGCPHTAEITSVALPKYGSQVVLSGGLDKRLALHSLGEGATSLLGSSFEVSSVTGLSLAQTHKNVFAVEFASPVNQVCLYDLRSCQMRSHMPAPAQTVLSYEGSKPGALSNGSFVVEDKQYGLAVDDIINLWDLRMPNKVMKTIKEESDSSYLRVYWHGGSQNIDMAVLGKRHLQLWSL